MKTSVEASAEAACWFFTATRDHVGNEEVWPLSRNAQVTPDAGVFIPVPPPVITGITG